MSEAAPWASMSSLHGCERSTRAQRCVHPQAAYCTKKISETTPCFSLFFFCCRDHDRVLLDKNKFIMQLISTKTPF